MCKRSSRPHTSALPNFLSPTRKYNISSGVFRVMLKSRGYEKSKLSYFLCGIGKPKKNMKNATRGERGRRWGGEKELQKPAGGESIGNFEIPSVVLKASGEIFGVIFLLHWERKLHLFVRKARQPLATAIVSQFTGGHQKCLPAFPAGSWRIRRSFARSKFGAVAPYVKVVHFDVTRPREEWRWKFRVCLAWGKTRRWERVWMLE